jgi:flavin-dependent dehydrogenase
MEGEMKVHDPRRETVSIVGGSAAGFYTAYLLAQKGVPVRLYEQASRLEPPARTLIVTSRLRTLLGPLAEGSVVNEIRQFELFTDGRSASIPLTRPDLVVERSRLIRSIADRAAREGAEICLSRKFVSLERNGHGLNVTLENPASGAAETVHAGDVVGADGAVSRVAQAAGWPRLPTVPLVQAVVRLPADMKPGTVRVWFVPQDTPYFYWLIPDSPTHGVLGLIGEDGRETRLRLESFLNRRGFAAENFQGARIPCYTRWTAVERRLGVGRVFLVGDAAGQVKVTTVGGIVTGFRGARGVAEAILNGGRSAELRRLRRELDVHLFIRRMLHRFTQADYSRLIDLLNPAARGALGVHDRDRAGAIIWRLCLKEPRLVLLGIRGLLTGGFLPGKT